MIYRYKTDSFNILEKNNLWVTLSHPKYTKPLKGNKTDRKDAKWICDLIESTLEEISLRATVMRQSLMP